MRLLSFRVQNCFGFRDSSPVDLDDPSNLIYVLGRNSAGKTALLTALAYLSPTRKPQDHDNLLNYNRHDDPPRLTAHFSVDKGDVTIERFMATYTAWLEKLNLNSPDILTNPDYAKFLNDIRAAIRPIYEPFIQEIDAAREVWVERDGVGSYTFSLGETFGNGSPRLAEVSSAMEAVWRTVAPPNSNAPAHHLLVGGNWRPLQLPTPEDCEQILFEQFPRIVWFSETYLLKENLPANITRQSLDDQSPLVQAFISLLGLDTVRRFLVAENPNELGELMTTMQNRLDALIKEVNDAARSRGIPDLLEITLFSRAGIQLNVKANGKYSYYRQISDNTKFLFAYFLYLRTHKIEGSILLFDEPSNGFHATAQEELLRFLKALGQRGNLVVVSTHSEHLIDPDHLTGVRLMESDSEGYLRVRNKWYASTSGRGDFQAFRPILDAIGLKYGSNHLTIHDKVIVTEGVTDLLYLRAFRQLLGITEDLNIAPATGDETILPVVALIISQGLKFKVVVDTAVGKKRIDQVLVNDYGMPSGSIYVVPVRSSFTSAKGSGIEDIFTKADFAKLLAATGNPPGATFAGMTNNDYVGKHSPVPKRVVAHTFLKDIGTYKQSDFEPETLEHARKLLDFCLNDAWCEM